VVRLVPSGTDHGNGRPVRVRHAARHARTSEPRPRNQTASLSIRSAERRRWAADLSGPGSGGLVICGMGGIGKSTLAAQIAARVGRLQSSRITSVMSGEVSAAAFADQGSGPAGAGFIVLENFDDNLTQASGRWTVRDPGLAALLGTWTGKLLITSRHPFVLTEQAGSIRLVFRHLGPLTRSGAAELTTALPAIGLLGEDERDQVYRLTAGHPLAMEYVDRLLAGGEHYPDLAGRIEAAIRTALKAQPLKAEPLRAGTLTGNGLPRTEPTELPEAAAELIASAAGQLTFGELFGRLSAGARSLLARTAAFSGPVAAGTVAARPGHIAECDAAGLLTVVSGRELAVHRWTAEQLRRKLAEPGPPPVRPARRRRRMAGAGALAVLSVVLAVEAGHELSVPHLASAQRPAPAGASSAPVTSATAVRTEVATWVARQVSRGAIVACDPAMCAALARRGVPSGNLLVLGPGAGDPLGSDVVIGTAAVRGLFGSRLAGVYAPEVLASFGTGASRVDVRVVAPDGSARYQRSLAADLRSRRAAGLQLLRDPRLTATPSARAALAAGRVDARLLIILAALAANEPASEPIRVTGFGAADPGASPGLPLRTAQLTAPGGTAPRMLAFLRAQRSPYQPSYASAAGPVVTVGFAAPAPLGLLDNQ
jgi:hypothetical protein